jgi:hypothetical protein
MRKAIYFDNRLGISSFLNNDVLIEKPVDYEVLDYYTISKWLEQSDKDDILIFAQDIIPYTAYEITPFNNDSKLLNFIRRGGIVTWIGDVPFFYRLHCFSKEYKEKIERVKDLLKKQVAFTPTPEFYLQKFGPYDKGDQICVLDIIGGFYVDVDRENVNWISLDYEHLGFFKLNEVCYLYSPSTVNKTLLGKLLQYESNASLRPIKYTTKILPLSLTTLSGVCKGKYAGSWIAQIREGYFIRLYDVKEELNAHKVFEITEKIASTNI